MRDALIAAAGLALLAAPTAARAQVDLEFEGSDRVTTCEVWGDVHLNGNPVDSMRTLRGGLDPDITIDGVEPFFGGPDGITLCEALAEREPRELCRKNSHTTAKVKSEICWEFWWRGQALSEADRGRRRPRSRDRARA